MNLLLLEERDFVAADRVRLGGRRREHAATVLGAKTGDELRVGLLGGSVGTGRVLRLDEETLDLEVTLDREPPPKLPLDLVLALPRPKVLRRVLQTVAALGIERLFLLHAYRVEKSYWQSPFLEPQAVAAQLALGLEQAGDTRPPVVELRRRFKPFVEDELPALAAGRRGLVAHPPGGGPCPRQVDGPVTLAVGPEGGFIPYEIERLTATGLEAVHLGPRILRVETVIPTLVGRLF